MKKRSIAAPYVWDEQAGAVVRSAVDKVDSNMQPAGGHGNVETKPRLRHRIGPHHDGSSTPVRGL